MKKTPLFLICILSINFTLGQSSTKIIHAFSNSFSMSTSSDMGEMSADAVKAKYHKTPDNKTLYYSNNDLSFSFVITTVAIGVKESELKENKNQIVDRFGNKGIQLQENEIKKINNHTIFVLSFYSNTPDEKIFNKRFFAVVKNNLVMVAFNCTESELKTRGSQIEESINSVEISD